MDDPSIARAPAAVSQNIDKIVQVESKALQPRMMPIVANLDGMSLSSTSSKKCTAGCLRAEKHIGKV
jgi:hypothetical protein